MSRIVASLIVAALLCLSAAGEDVSRQAPEWYARRLGALLSKADESLAHKADVADEGEPSVSLLNESVRWVDADGKSCVATHRIDLARNDQGVSRLARESIPFRKAEQKIYLVMARSIQPDGTSQEVAANAAFLQLPQQQMDSSVFSDYAELVILYPNMKAGTARESIIVTEELTSRIPGEFTLTLPFAAWWPQARVRYIVEMDPAPAKRLSVTTLGSGLPAPDRQALADQRVRWIWQRDRISKLAWEPGRAPIDQVGPVVFLTTLKNWDALASWYYGLLKGRDLARGPLAEVVQTKTKGVTDIPAVVEALFTEAAREVRYTGLEFGIAGFQPQDPNDVWANRYGDCKDKANLLRTMLREKKIPAYVALVNTEHTGRIDKRSPDYRHFDHAILAVPLAGGQYLFCDPTIKYGRPGVLGPDDTDREVLLIKENTAEWVRTPPQDAGTVRYDFDLKVAADGGLSGWLAIESDGYVGGSWLEYLDSSNREQMRERMLSLLQTFFRAAQMIDVEPMSPVNWKGVYKARMYFLVPGSGDSGRARDTLAFPSIESLLPDFGDTKTRETVYTQWRQTHQVHCRFQLPTGWAGIDLPRPFQVDAAPAGASASWEAKGSTVTASFELKTHQSQVAPEQYALLYTAVTSLRSWLGKPLNIAATKDAPTTAPATGPRLADFPLLPSGEGQLDLVDRQFPLEGNVALRREALARVLQWFPEDKPTRFIASLRLEEIALKDDPKDKAALERVRNLVAAAKGAVEPGYVAWGQYMLALWQADAGEKKEAIAVLTRQAGDASLSGFRRGWAAVEAARLLSADDPPQAVRVLEKSLDVESSAIPIQYRMLASMLLRQDKADALRDRLTEVVEGKPQQAGKILSALIDEAEKLFAQDRVASAAALLGMLEDLIGQSPELAYLNETLAPVKERVVGPAAYLSIANSIKAYLDRYRPEWWATTPLDPAVKTREQLKAAIKKAGDLPPLEPYIKYILEYLTRFPPEAADFPEQLWQAANSLQARNRDPELVALLLSCLDRLPKNDRWYFEGKFVRAARLSSRHDDAGAMVIYQSIAQNPDATAALRFGAHRRGGELLERQHKYTEALAAYKLLEADVAANIRSTEGLMRAIFINLEQGNRDEALRICGVLAATDPKTLKTMEDSAQVADFAALVKDPQRAREFWKRQETWWPMWITIEQQLKLPPLGDEIITPVIPDSVALGRDLGAAFRANDQEKFFKIFRKIVHCARWQPRFVIEWASVLDLAARLAPTHGKELREVMLVAMQGFESDDPQLMKSIALQTAIHLIDSGKSAEALEVIRKYRGAYKMEDAVGQAMNRLWGLAALRTEKDIDEAMHAMEADIASPGLTTDRALTVGTLAEVYRHAGRLEDEVKLLKTELDNADVKSNTTKTEALRARYQALLTTDRMPRFTAALTLWMRDHKPSWYDFAPPKDLRDYASQDLDALIRQPPSGLSTSEVVKFGLLVAQSPLQPIARRKEGFDLAIVWLSFLCPRYDDQQELYASIYENRLLDEPHRRHWLASAIWDLKAAGRDADALMNHPLAAGFTAADRQWMAAAEQFRAIDQDSVEPLVTFLSRLMESPVGADELSQWWDSFERLVQLDPAAARQFTKSAARITVAPGTRETAAAVRVKMMRMVSSAENVAAAQNAAREIVLTRIRLPSTGPATTRPADDWKQYRFLENLDWLDRQTALRVRLERVRGRRFSLRDFGIWVDIVKGADPAKSDSALGLAVLKALLSNLKEDADRSSVALDASLYFDYDDPAQYEKATAILKPYRDADHFPSTYAAIRLLEITVARRRGEPVDLDTAFRNVHVSDAAEHETNAKLSDYLRANNVDGLKRTLAAMTPEALLDPANLTKVLPALDAVGMTDEATLLREAGHKDLARAVLASWSTLHRRDMTRAFALAKALGASGEIPAAWVEHCLSHVQNTELRGNIRLSDAENRGDSATALTAVNDLLAERPRLYHLYLHKARALYQMGRKKEAAEALRPFLRYCNDQVDYPQAVELLKKCESE